MHRGPKHLASATLMSAHRRGLDEHPKYLRGPLGSNSRPDSKAVTHHLSMQLSEDDMSVAVGKHLKQCAIIDDILRKGLATMYLLKI